MQPVRSRRQHPRVADADDAARRVLTGREAREPSRVDATDRRDDGASATRRAQAADRRAAAEQRRMQNERKAGLAVALVGVSIVNSFAPLWGPALGAHTLHPTRAALERIVAAEPRLPTHGVLSTLDARCLQLRRAPIIGAVDAQLDAVDRALALPHGSARTLAVERALVDAGVAPELARDTAHLAASAARATALAADLERAVAEGRLDLERIGLQAADGLDRLLSDPQLSLAFAAGAATAPRIPLPAASALSAFGHVGKALLDAKLRHDHALDHLKSLQSGNPIIDVAGRVAGELADLATFALTFLGPGPFVAAARGTDLLLVAAQLIAAKTAVAGTVKAIGSYSNVPAEIVAFALGVAAEASAQQALSSIEGDAHVLAAQRDMIADGLSSAMRDRDPQRALEAVLSAWDQATPHEREALQRLVQLGAERMATEAGHAPPLRG